MPSLRNASKPLAHNLALFTRPLDAIVDELQAPLPSWQQLVERSAPSLELLEIGCGAGRALVQAVVDIEADGKRKVSSTCLTSLAWNAAALFSPGAEIGNISWQVRERFRHDGLGALLETGPMDALAISRRWGMRTPRSTSPVVVDQDFMRGLPFEDARFSLIISQASFKLFPDPRTSLPPVATEITRVLRSNGVCLLQLAQSRHVLPRAGFQWLSSPILTSFREGDALLLPEAEPNRTRPRIDDDAILRRWSNASSGHSENVGVVPFEVAVGVPPRHASCMVSILVGTRTSLLLLLFHLEPPQIDGVQRHGVWRSRVTTAQCAAFASHSPLLARLGAGDLVAQRRSETREVLDALARRGDELFAMDAVRSDQITHGKSNAPNSEGGTRRSFQQRRRRSHEAKWQAMVELRLIAARQWLRTWKSLSTWQPLTKPSAVRRSDAATQSQEFAASFCNTSRGVDQREAQIRGAATEMQPRPSEKETKHVVQRLLRCQQALCSNYTNTTLQSRPLIQYILLGAPKCASSSLHNLLQAHPNIMHSHAKVLHMFYTPWQTVDGAIPVAAARHGFFNVTPLKWAPAPVDAASSWISMCHAHRAYGVGADRRNGPKQELFSDASNAASHPGFLGYHDPQLLYANRTVIEAIRRYAGPDVRFILTLCDPSERALTMYRFGYYKKGMFTTHRNAQPVANQSFEKVVDDQLYFIPSAYRSADPASAIDERSGELDLNEAVPPSGHEAMLRQGLYALALSRWMRIFPPNRFFLLSKEALAASPRSTMRAIERFLDLPPANWTDELLFKRRNVNIYGRTSATTMAQIEGDGTWAKLRRFYRPHCSWLTTLLKQTSSPTIPQWNTTRCFMTI